MTLNRPFALVAATLVLCATLAAAALAASTNFDEPATSPETGGTRPSDVAAADFDGDSDQDLAFPNPIVDDETDGEEITVLKNRGSGDFFEPSSSPEAANPRPGAVVAADLDGDDDPDLAVANSFPSAVTILRNNGAGNFAEVGSSPEAVGDRPIEIVAADFDGDGDPDLATANNDSDDLTILRNNGSGNLTELGSSPEALSSEASGLVAADLDGDADPDLATSHRNSSTVTLLRNNGAGGFSEFGSSPEAVGLTPDDIVAVDFDADADEDLVTADGGLDQLTMLRNNGAGGFAELSSSPEAAGDRPFALAAADFDGDGDQDLGVANLDSDDVTILRNSGAGNLSEPGSSPEPTQGDSVAIAAADFDGDADPDLATANFGFDNATILINR